MSTFESKPSDSALRALTEASGEKTDAGELVGRDPREVPLGLLARYHREKNPLKAIRARCLDCCCGNPKEVRKCVSVNCPSWPFRMGVNPFREKRVYSDEQKAAMAAQFRSGEDA